MQNGKPDLRNDLDSIKSDIAALQADLASALKDLVAAGKGEAGAAKERLENEIRERLDKLSYKADLLARRGRRAIGSLEEHIEEKPLQSVGIALGIGVVIGALLSRR
jgi:ElaB/YqjD/DUF883 family membrane-anchored ribosome-binding protein